MKNIFTIIIISIALIGQLSAKEVKPQTAQKAAKNFYLQKAGITDNTKNGQFELGLSYVETRLTDTLFYAFSANNNQGFVLISADDIITPVLAYSTTGSFSGEDMPPATQYLLNEYSDQIALAKRNKAVASEKVSLEWSKLLNGNNNQLKTLTTTTPQPLLLTNWSQGFPYNEFCPVDSAGPAGHALVGCVAVSMAQVMKYYNYPAQGSGSSSYYANGYGTQTAQYGNTDYEFYNMPNTGHESNPSLAEFMYHCGVGAEMNYGPDGSGAWVMTACEAMEAHFNYASTWDYDNRNSYSDTQWKNIIKNEIDNLRPTIYVGYDSNSGHAWNCDGYQNDHFHMNWGWGGSYNGYYSIDNLSPGTYDFYTGHKLAYNLYPGGSYPEHCGASTTITGMEGTFNDGSGPEEYQNEMDCYWEIIPECGQNVYLSLDQFDLQTGDTLYIYAGLSTTDPLLIKLSDTLEIPATIMSPAGGMLLNFVTNNSDAKSGWTASYSVDFCNGNRYLYDETGIVEDGSGSCNYRNASLCRWYIQPEGADSISINFTNFDLPNDIDNVKIYQDNTSNLIAKFNYNNQPYPVTVNSGMAIVHFFSDGNGNAGGWELDYEGHFSTTSVGENQLNDLVIYPNPTDNVLNIAGRINDTEEMDISIHNSIGQVVQMRKQTKVFGNYELQFDLSDVPAGIYFVQIKTGQQVITRRFIKE
ncbi:MAG: C10 family peptidase [Bacteroidales bacterium]|nr:C10 family peptidase [Bacteroidales bacterium]MCF8454570.1 C10 family peptidase [Bacteroidales bacterium]